MFLQLGGRARLRRAPESGEVVLAGRRLLVGGLACVLGVLVLVLPGAASAAPLGSLEVFTSGFGEPAVPVSIASGSDGNLWFADLLGQAIGRVTTSGSIEEFKSGLQEKSAPRAIAAGPDGKLWFTDGGSIVGGSSAVGMIDPATHAIEEFTGLKGQPGAITIGSDGGVWFLERGETSEEDLIGRIDPTTHAIKEFAGGPKFEANESNNIVSGADGDLWFTDAGKNNVDRITTAGVISEFGSGLLTNIKGIAAGPDGNLWFGEWGGVNETQKIKFVAGESAWSNGNTFTLAFSGKTTEPIAYSGTTSTMTKNIRVALEALTVIGEGNVKVSGSGPAGITVEFNGALSVADEPELSCSVVTSGGTCGVETTKQGSPNVIDRISTSGTITKFTTGAGVHPTWLVAGPDGDIWFAEESTLHSIGRLTPAGAVTLFSGDLSRNTHGLVVGPDGNLWSAEAGASAAISRFGVGAQSASLRAPSVMGSSEVGTQQACGGDRWATWAGVQPEDGGLLPFSSSPSAVQWLLDGSPIVGATSLAYMPVVGDLGKQLSCKLTETYRYPLFVTVSATSAGVKVIAQNSGPEGKEGKTGATGPAGAKGATGPVGATGAQGPAGQNGVAGAQGPAGAQGSAGGQGPAGAQGPAGRDGKVTCKVVQKKGGKAKVTCTVKLVAASARAARVRWSLTKGGRAYAHGVARAGSDGGVSVRLAGLVRGRYRLHVQGRGGSVTVLVG